MVIIGVDYHPSFQQIAFMDQETGECGERRLNHSDGEAERFYRELKQRGTSVSNPWPPSPRARKSGPGITSGYPVIRPQSRSIMQPHSLRKEACPGISLTGIGHIRDSLPGSAATELERFMYLPSL